MFNFKEVYSNSTEHESKIDTGEQAGNFEHSKSFACNWKKGGSIKSYHERLFLLDSIKHLRVFE